MAEIRSSEIHNMSAVDMIKESIMQKEAEKQANETKLSQKDALKDEILGSIMKALDDKD